MWSRIRGWIRGRITVRPRFWPVKISNLFPEATAAAMTVLKSFILENWLLRIFLSFSWFLKIQTEYFSCESGCFFPSIIRVLYHSSNAWGHWMILCKRKKILIELSFLPHLFVILPKMTINGWSNLSIITIFVFITTVWIGNPNRTVYSINQHN